MNSDSLVIIMFGFPALFIMIGVYYQSKAVLERARGNISFGKFWAVSLKYLGFSILAFLVYKFRGNILYTGLFVFIATYIVSFLLYLLARRASLR